MKSSELTKVLIVEDEMLIAANISLQLTDLGYRVTDLLSKGEDVLQSIKLEPPHIIVLDINLKGNLNGIETAKRVNREYNIPIIYLTANSDHSNFKHAKETRPVAFISKPFKKIDLNHAIELALQNTSLTTNPGPHNAVSESELIDDRIFIKHKDSLKKVNCNTICYVEAKRNYCNIHTVNETHLIVATMKKLLKMLPQHSFSRIHRSYVVNLYKLDEISIDHVVIGKKILPLSRSYKDVIFKRLKTI